jgi:hypothetical protein
MLYLFLAHLALTLHVAFIVFVVLGGLLVAWRGWVAWAHIPAAIWGVLITVFGWTCPLTPLEIYFRRRAGQAGYTEGFIEHYVVSLIYPGGLTQTGFVLLGLAVLGVNVAIYTWICRRTRRLA